MEVKLKASLRTEKGKGAAKRFRHSEMIPAVYYGRKIETVPLLVNVRDFKSAMATEAGSNVLINLEIEGELPDFLKGRQTVIVKEIQRHPVRGDILHVDFHKVIMSEEIQAAVPIILVGEAAGVKLGGVLQQPIREVNVKCLPKYIPEHIEVGVSELEIGDNIHLSDLPAVEGVEFLDDPEEILVSVIPPTKVEVPVAAPEEEEEVAVEPELVGEKKEEAEEAAEGGPTPSKEEGEKKES